MLIDSNKILVIIFLTLMIHSFIGTIIFILTNENKNFAVYYGLGIVGILISGFFYIARFIKKWCKNYNKRSIFEDENGNKFYCKVKYANDFCCYEKMVKLYATKDEWKDLTPFSKEQIELAKINCERYKGDSRL